MAYQKTNWNLTTTPLDPNNLNKIEEGIYDNDAEITNIKNGTTVINSLKTLWNGTVITIPLDSTGVSLSLSESFSNYKMIGIEYYYEYDQIRHIAWVKGFTNSGGTYISVGHMVRPGKFLSFGVEGSGSTLYFKNAKMYTFGSSVADGAAYTKVTAIYGLK